MVLLLVRAKPKPTVGVTIQNLKLYNIKLMFFKQMGISAL